MFSKYKKTILHFQSKIMKKYHRRKINGSIARLKLLNKLLAKKEKMSVNDCIIVLKNKWH